MKKSLLTLLCCISFLLLGCQPEGVIPREEMTSLLADLYLADGCIEASSNHAQSWDSVDVYGPLLEAHGVTPELFNASVDYYLAHPDEFIKIYSNVVQKLAEEGRMIEDQEMQDEMQEEMDEEPEEGVEPAIEKEEAEAEVKAVKEKKPEKSSRNTRKRLSKKELKDLEKQMK